MKKILLASALATAVLIAASPSHAVDLKLPKAKPAAEAPAEGVDTMAMQEGLVQRYMEASSYITAAQIELSKAFELKEQAALLESEAASLQGGATLDKDAIKKNRKVSDDAAAAIQAKIDAGAPLSDEGKRHYIASFVPFVQGMAVTKELPAEASTFSDAAQTTLKSASLTEKASLTSKLSAGTYVAKEIPGFSSKMMDTFKKIVTYAQKNDIPVPADATAMLSM